MTKKTKTPEKPQEAAQATATETPPVATNGSQAPADDTQRRLKACAVELQAVLTKHGFQIVAGLADPMPVGYQGDTVQLTALWRLAEIPPGR